MRSLIAPNAPRAKTGRPPFELVILQQWVGLSDLAIEEALFETALYRQFAGLSSVERIPDQVSILRFRHLLEERQLAPQILAVVNLGRQRLDAQARHSGGRHLDSRTQLDQEPGWRA